MQRRLVLAGGLVAAALTAIVLTASIASAASGNIGFGFNARNISGFRTGSATLTGGGSYNPVTGFVKSAGGFRCTNDIGQGPLKGCLSGEGVRWDTVNLLRSTNFKCTGSAAMSFWLDSRQANRWSWSMSDPPRSIKQRMLPERFQSRLRSWSRGCGSYHASGRSWLTAVVRTALLRRKRSAHSVTTVTPPDTSATGCRSGPTPGTVSSRTESGQIT